MKLVIISGIMAIFGSIVSVISGFVEPYLPQSIFNAIVVALILIVFGIYVDRRIEREAGNSVPSTFILIVEFFKDSVDGLVESTMGAHNAKFGPFIFALFSFLILSNLTGLIGLDSPTANYSVTLALALLTFVLSQYFSIKSSGIGGHIKGYFEPFVLLSPLNIIGDLANPVSLSFRLFGNILSGGLIMTLIRGAFGNLSPLVAAPLQIYFDIFSGVLQAFIFTMLTMVFIASGINEE